MSNLQSLHWHIFPDANTVAQQACQKILTAARQAIAARGAFHLVLAGGRTPEACYRYLSQAQADWQYWHLYYGDERCLPVGHAERNSQMVQTAWLDHVAIPAQQHHIIPAEREPETAARQYSQLIAPVLPFDLALLGMGEDGHTASLFPDHQYLPAPHWTHAVYNAPKPPAERVSLSVAALSSTRQVLFLITGESKQNAVKAWKNGKDLPISRIYSEKETAVYIDQAALSIPK
ncbi:6-phosphogluconolactonase [Candidatus Venteria ishoeyi]|uniref:6-phosphogluconolactonase n=1 Tax=Candidatus Venteria ishoeyi TaxID=1899563 RepID=A0A1H6FCM4_9GAMM|nr:6-phosphogluconolactonase [Candidatus Venteria ishoeyi]SEH06765.1 6-phosphogluconolactonase [Candidatus Venteria ishoeyi]